MEKLEKEFHIQYDKSVPYYLKNIEMLKECLHTEFIELETHPNFNIYLDFFNINDYKPETSERRKVEIVNKFHELIKTNSLPVNCYAAKLEETDTFKIIKEIDETLNVFEKSLFSENTDKYKGPEIIASTIERSLNKLKNGVLLGIIKEAVLANNENIQLTIIESFPAIKDTREKILTYRQLWDEMKMTFNLKLGSIVFKETETVIMSSAFITPNYLLDEKSITESHRIFDTLVQVNLADYLRCFDLNDPNPPKLNYGKGKTNFYYFLNKITGMTDKIGLERFGVANLRNYSTYRVSAVISNKVSALVNNKTPIRIN